MPGFDGRGPMGKGPGTGRGMGRCRLPNDSDSSHDEEIKDLGDPGFFGRGLRRRSRRCMRSERGHRWRGPFVGRGKMD